MSPDRFDHLLSLVEPAITKQNNNYRQPISAAERLCLTIRFLASGDSQQSLSFAFRIGRSTVSGIIRETCEAIYNILAPIYLKPPSSPQEWKKISKEFEETWNLPHVIGAIDGKHIRVKYPAGSGTLYHNYKGFFSIILLAVCDANYGFTMIDIGEYGSNNDSGVLLRSEINRKFENGSVNLAQPSTLEGCKLDPLPYYMVGDEIFPLKNWLMRPYPGKEIRDEESVYNCRHSAARRTVENAFGIMTTRWRILNNPINASVENIEKYVMAIMVLHNYLRSTENATYCPKGFSDSTASSGDFIPGDWRALINTTNPLMTNLRPVRGSRYRHDAIFMRNSLRDYVNSASGKLDWQLDHVRRT